MKKVLLACLLGIFTLITVWAFCDYNTTSVSVEDQYGGRRQLRQQRRQQRKQKRHKKVIIDGREYIIEID